MLAISVSKTTRKSRRSSATVFSDAVAFLGQLKQNEELLTEHAKNLEKKDRVYLQQVFSAAVEGWTPFHAFVLRGARKLLKIALRCGVDSNLKMGQPDNLPDGCSALHLAAYRGDVSVIQILLQHGADVNVLDGNQKTPVYYAATHDNTLAVRKLLKEGANIEDIDKERREIYKTKHVRSPTTFMCLKSTLL